MDSLNAAITSLKVALMSTVTMLILGIMMSLARASEKSNTL